MLSALLLLSGCTGGTNSPSSSAPSDSSSPAPVSKEDPNAGCEKGDSAKAAQAEEEVDVAIIGSELEGLYLARAAADEGLKVKILDPRSSFGGQVLQGEMLFLDETKDESKHSLVQGRVKKLFDGFKGAKIRKTSEFEAYMTKLVDQIPLEQGVTLGHIDTIASNGGCSVDRIEYSTKDGKSHSIHARYWADNTDYAALASKLKTNRLPGLEKLYGQSRPEFMSAGMIMKFKHVDWDKFSKTYNQLPASEKKERFGGGYVNKDFAIGLSGIAKQFQPSSDRTFLRGLNAVNQRDGEVLINALLVYDVDPADPSSVKTAVELGNKETPRVLELFKKTLPGWENAEVNGFPSYLYIREYNHYESEYVMKPSDLLSGRMFWDNVSIGGYPMDLQGITANKWGTEMGRPDKYGIPLRSFLLKGYPNVILAGKNVGVSAIAYGSVRIQPNTSLGAEMIGILIGQLPKNQNLASISREEMSRIQGYAASKYKIKLNGEAGKNKIKDWDQDEINKLDEGEISYTSYKPKKH
ncbi:FAD-dependent oxidoreductase [Paenibacillus larvae]|nr:FAD-dependent oxidoreductase [Paenibacillus larvae]